MPTKQKLGAVAGLLAGAVGWGVMWYPYRVLDQAGVSGEVSSFLTYLVASLLGVLFFFRHLAKFAGVVAILTVIGVTAGWTNLAYVLAVIGGEVVRVMLLFYLAPLWTVFFSRLLLGEKVSAQGYLILLISLSGAVVMLWDAQASLPLPRNTAEWLALSAGVTFALSNVMTRRAHDLSVSVKSLAIWFGACLLSMMPVLAAPQKMAGIFHLSGTVWLLLIGTGVALFLITMAVQYGLTHTPANQAILIFLSELVVAAISSYYLAGEAMGLKEWIGGAMIVVGSLFSGKVDKQNDH